MNFERLNMLIKSGDDNYYVDLDAETLIKYSNSYLLFRLMKNRKGMGIVLNNMGNIHSKLNRIDEAISSYKQSLELAELDLMEILLVDNLYVFYKVEPTKGWRNIKKKSDFEDEYFKYNLSKRKKVILVNRKQKIIFENTLANRTYQYSYALMQGYYKSTSTELKQEMIENAIDNLMLT